MKSAINNFIFRAGFINMCRTNGTWHKRHEMVGNAVTNSHCSANPHVAIRDFFTVQYPLTSAVLNAQIPNWNEEISGMDAPSDILFHRWLSSVCAKATLSGISPGVLLHWKCLSWPSLHLWELLRAPQLSNNSAVLKQFLQTACSPDGLWARWWMWRFCLKCSLQ